MSVHVLALDRGWTVRATRGPVPPELADVLARGIPATVPGCIHLDLLDAGLIPDPYQDENEALVQWVGQVDWRYATTFDWAPDEARTDLVFAGLDTVARIDLNGTEVARTANMHRQYRVAVADRLRPGRNDLAVEFRAGLDAAREAEAVLGPRPNAYPLPFNAIRKMACNFGWDWGPTLITAGLWRPARLESWRTARLAAVRPLVDVDGTSGVLHAHVDVQRATDAPLAVVVDVAGQRAEASLAPGETTAVVDVRVPDVDLWWPHAHGGQPLYDVTVRLSGDGALDTWTGRVGFRTIRADVTPDQHGTGFTLVVNDRPIFARGVNWIPDDCFPARITAARYRTRLQQAKDAHVDLVRVWGGGIYESDDFYAACDELGLLVWQDFLFACAAYAEEEPLRGEVLAEARDNVTRLSPHPSLALWNGNNENLWGFADWGWADALDGRTWGLGYYTELLPAVVAELDPSRPYTPGSPFSPDMHRHPNDPAHGSMHIWDVWNERDYVHYRDYVPRFVAEFGFQGPPTWATLTAAVHDAGLAPDSPGLLAHQKAVEGNTKLARGLAGHLPTPEGIADWHWATSLNQARAVAFGVTHLRSWSPVCRGAIVWQLNDTWPATSWAAIDSGGRRKPLWYALRRAFADRLLTVQPRDGGLCVVAVNDSARAWSDTLVVRRRRLDGTLLASVDVPLQVAAWSTQTVLLPPDVAVAANPAAEVLTADAGSERGWWRWAEDVAMDLPKAELDCVADRDRAGYRLRVTARSYVRDLTLLADRLAPDADVDDQLVTLLPGESHTFRVTTTAELTAAQLTAPDVLRSANQLVT